MVVIDRATTGDPGRALYLRFRTPGTLTADGDVARARVGRTQLTIRRLDASPGTPWPDVRRLAKGDCFADGTVRGTCDAARFPVGEYRVTVPGPKPWAVHVLDVGGKAPAAAAMSGAGPHVIRIGDRHVVVFADDVGDTLAYRAPRPASGGTGEHVVLDVPAAADGTVGASARPVGDLCAVTLTRTGGDLRVSARPAVLALDHACRVRPAAPAADDGGGAAGAAGSARAARPHAEPHSSRGGCCGAQATAGSPAAMSVVVGLGLLGLGRGQRRRRARRRRARR